MQKFLRNLTLVALMVLPWVASAQNTLTVADGTTTNGNVPVYGLWADAYLRCQTIYPAADIAAEVNTIDMNGGTITGLTFYSSSSASYSGTFVVKMTEVTATTLNGWADVSNATTVYTGSLTIGSGVMQITFDNGYTYNGGNLLVEVSQTSTGGWTSCSFYGISASGASWQGYNSSSWDGITGSAQGFMPKTTFTFTGGTPVTCPAVQSYGLGTVDSNSAVITWVDALNSGASYTVTYWADGDANNPLTETSSGDSATLTGLNANTVYHYTVQVNCSATDNSVALGGTFRTACGTITLPYFVDFEDAAYNGAWYPCWDSTIHAGTDPSVNDQNSPANHTAGGTYAMYLQSNSSQNYNLVVSPAVPLPGNQIFVNFWARVNSSAWLKAGVMTNPRDTSTFIPLVEVSGNSWNEYNFSTSALDPNATYYVAWLGYRNSGFIGKFDDVTIREDLGCNKPSMAMVDSVGPYNAYLRWANGGASATDYDVFYNTTNNIDGAQVVNTSDTAYELTNLLPQTTYYAWVRTACSGDSAEVKAFPSFTTQMTCAPLTGVSMGNISYTAAQISWNYDTTQGFPTEGVNIALIDNTDTNEAPLIIDVTGNTYTFGNLAAGHGYTAILRNMCSAPSQTDTAAANTITFMTQSCSEISSDGNTNNYIPTYTYYGNTYSQSLYLASEMPNVDSIHGIAFNVVSTNSGNNSNRQFDVYVRHVDTNAFDGNNYFPVDSSMLYATNFTFSTAVAGWQVIPFNNTFVYDGTSNLLIVINDHTNAWVSAASFASISAQNRGKYSYRDSNPWTPSDMTDGNNINYIPAVRFVADCEVPQCFAPMLSVDTVDANSIGISWVSVGTEDSWVVGIKAYGASDYTFEPNAITDTFYTFTNLSSSMSYEVIVGSVCPAGDTLFATAQATTDCAGGSCNITVAMVDSYGDGWNGAKLSFTQNGAVAGEATLGSGSSATATISVCSGAPVNYSWQTGSFDSECSYVIYDGSGAEVYNSATSGVNHSDVILDPCPTCLLPVGVMASAIDSNELTFVWTEDVNVDHYIVSFNGGGYTLPNNGNASHMVSGLTPNTAYTFSVIAICEPNVDSSVARTITVKTACGEMLLPVVEGFESDNDGSVPSCWNVVSGSPAVTTSSYYAHTGNNSLALESGDMIATSQVPLNGDSIYVSFWADVYSGTLQAGVMTNPLYDSTFTPLLTVTSTNSYEMFEFNTATMDHYTNYYVAFRFNGSSYYGINIDDINIRKNEGCMYPANLTATPAAHSVDLTWVNNSSNNDFVVQYRAASATAWDTTVAVNDTTYTVNGLNAASNYVFRVGYLCNNDTLWTSPLSAQTTCDLLPVPYFENFYSATGTLPPCWDYQSPVGWNNWPETSGNGELMFGAYSNGVPAVMPQFAANFSKLQITFYTKCRPDSEGDGIMIGVADAAGNLIAWIDTLHHPNHSQAAWVEHTYNFLNYYGPGERIALGRALSGPGNLWASIDSITVISLPDCYPVDSLTIHNAIDPDHTNFTWHPLGNEAEWQVYVDTVTVDIDNVPDSLLVDVFNTPYYEIPMGTIQGGGIYTFYVRANCGMEQSSWTSYTFGAGTYVMNNSATADTVVACGLVVYDNGGPVAGYADYSNSALVIRAENAGSELQVFGGKFGWGESSITLTIYDGEGTAGTVLYQKTNTGTTNYTLDSVLATSTTGAMTITFTCSGNYVHTGYELYIHCVGTALCERPTQLNAVMTGNGEANVTWNGSAASYDLYYKLTDAATWTVQSGINGTSTTLTGLTPDTTYVLQVVGICGTDTSTASFPATLNTHYTVVILPCDPVTNLAVNNVTSNSATLSWTSTADAWEIELTNVSGSTNLTASTNPYTLTGLLPNLGYSVRVRALCNGQNYEPTSEWSAAVTFTTDTVSSQGIDGADFVGSFVLYPNPATTTVTLDLTGVEDAAIVSIIDLNGREVFAEKAGGAKMTVNVAGFAKGAYFVRVTGSNTTAVRKLIVK